MTEHELDKRLAALPRGLAPGRDLWADIDGRLNERPHEEAGPRRLLLARGKPGHMQRPLRAAFAAVAAVAVLALVFAAGTLARPKTSAEKALATIETAGREYRRAANELVESFSAIASTYGSEHIVEELRVELGAVDRLIVHLALAVREDAEDEYASYELAALYQTQTRSIRRTIAYVRSLGSANTRSIQ